MITPLISSKCVRVFIFVFKAGNATVFTNCHGLSRISDLVINIVEHLATGHSAQELVDTKLELKDNQI